MSVNLFSGHKCLERARPHRVGTLCGRRGHLGGIDRIVRCPICSFWKPDKSVYLTSCNDDYVERQDLDRARAGCIVNPLAAMIAAENS